MALTLDSLWTHNSAMISTGRWNLKRTLLVCIPLFLVVFIPLLVIAAAGLWGMAQHYREGRAAKAELREVVIKLQVGIENGVTIDVFREKHRAVNEVYRLHEQHLTECAEEIGRINLLATAVDYCWLRQIKGWSLYASQDEDVILAAVIDPTGIRDWAVKYRASESERERTRQRAIDPHPLVRRGLERIHEECEGLAGRLDG